MELGGRPQPPSFGTAEQALELIVYLQLNINRRISHWRFIPLNAQNREI